MRTAALCVGLVACGRIGFDVEPGNAFDGMIDDVRLYDSALTAPEIAALASP